MKSYSQNQEQEVILEYFGEKSDGRLLEIGAYHFECFSNSRALILRGWTAVLVEPSPRCFVGLMAAYKDNPNVMLVNACMSGESKMIAFHDSEGACATTDKAHFERWNPIQKDFQTIFLPTLTPSQLMNQAVNYFDFLSIDTEGNDFDILQAIPSKCFQKLKMICIEYGKDLERIHGFLIPMGFKEIHRNAENTILTKS